MPTPKFNRFCLLFFPLLLLLSACDDSPVASDFNDSNRPGRDDSASRVAERLKVPPKPKGYFQDEAVKYMNQWLTTNGETGLIEVDDVVGVSGNPVRIKPILDDYKKAMESNEDFEVYTRFYITVDEGAEIEEYINGTGRSFDEAVQNSMENFTNTTFQPLYKAFFNPSFELETEHRVKLSGVSRKLFAGDILVESDQENPLDGFLLGSEMKDVLQELQVDEKKHWIKVAYGQLDGETFLASVTLDNLVDTDLTEKVKALEWPKVDGRLVFKQFFVIE